MFHLVTAGKRFMIDLLVSSLTGDGELEAAFDNTVAEEIDELRRQKEVPTKRVESDVLEHENLMSAEAVQAKREELARRTKSNDSGKGSPAQLIPLLSLVKQLLKTGSDGTLNRLNGLPTSFFVSTPESSPAQDMSMSPSSVLRMDKSSPSISLLLKFQRLLISRLLAMQNRLQESTWSGGNSWLSHSVL